MSSIEWRVLPLGTSEDEIYRLVNQGYVRRRHPNNSELVQVSVLPINTPKYRPLNVPHGAVPAERPPLTAEGKPCNPDGDIDRFGKHCKVIEGIWWRWYPHNNEPFF